MLLISAPQGQESVVWSLHIPSLRQVPSTEQVFNQHLVDDWPTKKSLTGTSLLLGEITHIVKIPIIPKLC